MPGLNPNGAPTTRDYEIGRGRVYLANLTSAGLPDLSGFLDVGNVVEFTITVNEEDIRHQSSRTGLKFTDKRCIISKELELSMILDNIDFQNLARFLSGTTSTYDNGHDSAWTAHEDSIVSSAVVLGRWYKLYDDDSGAPAAGTRRCYDLGATGCVYSFEEDPAGTPTALVAGTDYEIDADMGMVRFLPTATNVAGGDTVGWAITTAATTPNDLDEVAALQLSDQSVALLFIRENACDGDQKTEWTFHKVSLSSTGDFSGIGDEWAQLSFTGVAEVNNGVPDTSKVLSVRTFDQQA